MNKHAVTTLILISLMLTLTLASIQPAVANANSAEDWPMFHHDPAHTGYTTANITPSTLAVLWSSGPGSLSGLTYQDSPAVLNGAVYVSDAQTLYAYNASTGTELWTSANPYPDPTANAGYVYAGGTAINASTGKVVWNAPIQGSSTLANGYLYVNGYYALAAVNASTGAQIWQKPTNFQDATTAYSNGVLYMSGTDGNFYAYNASNGAELWSSPMKSNLFSVPAVYDGYVYIGAYNGFLYCFDASNGTVAWTFGTGESFVYSSPAVGNGVVYVGSSDGSGSLYALNASTGQKLWSFPNRGVVSSPDVAGGVVYFCDTYGNLYALNAENGNERLLYTFYSYTYSADNPNFVALKASPAIANGCIYLSSPDHVMLVLGSSANATPSPTQSSTSAPTPSSTPSAAPTSSPTTTQSTIPASSPNPKTSIPEFPTWIILPFLIAATTAALAFAKKKKAKTTKPKSRLPLPQFSNTKRESAQRQPCFKDPTLEHACNHQS